MHKVVGLVLLIMGASSAVMAAGVIISPEIDVSTGIAAVAILAGGILVLRGRRKK